MLMNSSGLVALSASSFQGCVLPQVVEEAKAREPDCVKKINGLSDGVEDMSLALQLLVYKTPKQKVFLI